MPLSGNPQSFITFGLKETAAEKQRRSRSESKTANLNDIRNSLEIPPPGEEG